MDVVPLEDQLAAFEAGWEQAVSRLLRELSKRSSQERVYLLARARLHAGFRQYGDRAWHWDKWERRRNIDEELADAIVYLISGEVP